LPRPALSRPCPPFHGCSSSSRSFYRIGAAVVTALFSNNPGSYVEATVPGLQELINPEVWETPDPVLGARRVAEAQITILESYRKANHTKGQIILYAIAAEIVAVAFLVLSIVVLLIHG